MGTSLPRREHPEERYQAELLSTDVSPRTAKVMVWAFVAMLAVVPVSQAVSELAARQVPQVVDVLAPVRALLRSAMHGDLTAIAGAWRTLTSREFPRGFEHQLERASLLKQWLQPRIQSVLTARLGFGNDKGVVGRDGWLFYNPGLEYITGPDFVDPETIRLVAKRMIDKDGVADPQPDPRPAIAALHRAAAAAGMHLLVVPIPDKVMLQPDQLTARADGWPPGLRVGNRGYERFLADMRASGVDVLDPTPKDASPQPRYLAQDTHWTPAFMDEVSASVAARVDAVLADQRETDPSRFRTRTLSVSRVGDLVDILKLPPSQTHFPPATITVDAVEGSDGRPWARDPLADVLVLGDSFTNIFSDPAMGWGASAGFSEHLSLHLNRPVDVIALNGGATAVRQELSRRAATSDRPWTTRVIVYAFAMRSLANEHWPVLPFAPPSAAVATAAPNPAPSPDIVAAVEPALKTGATVAEVTAPVTVTAQVVQTSPVPAPGTAPYKDCLTFVKLRVVTTSAGRIRGPEIIGAFLAMRDNEWLPAASYAVGDTLQLTLVPMAMAPLEIQAMQRADTLDDVVLAVYFVTAEKKQE